MNKIIPTALAVVCIALYGCEVFLDDIGGEGNRAQAIISAKKACYAISESV